MRDDEQSSTKRIQQVFKRCESLNIEIVGRLIKHQDVWLCHQQSSELKTSTFATTQVADWRPLRICTESEPLTQLGCREFATFAEFHSSRDVLHCFKHSPLRIEFLKML